MTVTINESGMMIVVSETPLEAFALQAWLKQNDQYIKGSSTLFRAETISASPKEVNHKRKP
jgi:hypothetical protein